MRVFLMLLCDRKMNWNRLREEWSVWREAWGVRNEMGFRCRAWANTMVKQNLYCTRFGYPRNLFTRRHAVIYSYYVMPYLWKIRKISTINGTWRTLSIWVQELKGSIILYCAQYHSALYNTLKFNIKSRVGQKKIGIGFKKINMAFSPAQRVIRDLIGIKLSWAINYR